jgi:hypothetical protein
MGHPLSTTDKIDLAANTKIITVMALGARLTKEKRQTAHE